MQDQIDMICTLAGCDQTMAREVFNETNDVTLAVDKILFKTELPSKKKQVRDVVSKKIAEIRETMKEFDKKMDERPDSTINQFPSTLSSRLVREVLDERQVHREETVLQNNCSQQCQIPSLESEAQKQETVYP
jgi:hypothetical protein